MPATAVHLGNTISTRIDRMDARVAPLEHKPEGPTAVPYTETIQSVAWK